MGFGPALTAAYGLHCQEPRTHRLPLPIPRALTRGVSPGVASCLDRGEFATCIARTHHSPNSSDRLLQSSHAEGLHDRLRWLRLHHHHLAEHLSLPSLGCWLQAGLYHHDSRDGELAL